jgi:restriction system protein
LLSAIQQFNNNANGDGVPRKKQPSGFDVILDVATIIPWYVSLPLAAVSFGFLHYYSGLPVAPIDLSKNPAGGLTFMLETLKHGGAGILQYIVPGPLVMGAGISLFRRKRDAGLHDRVAADPAPNALEKVTWQEFEYLVAETFRRQGYQVSPRGGDGPDGGVDVELRMGGDKYLVQCKQWKTRQVGVAIVRELYGVMAADGAVGGFVVASGQFTPDAAAFARGKSIELVDARGLRRLMGGQQAAQTATQSHVGRRAPLGTAPALSVVSAAPTVPSCPVCGRTMLQRTGKQGLMAGQQFWGCSGYPKCRGIRKQ